MTASPKADIQNVRVGVALNVRFWPKRTLEPLKKAAPLCAIGPRRFWGPEFGFEDREF